ncbi:nitroreductase [Fictibacillus iocasae]|uniref:Putative NAD(P)H nitroreductase n=1 Tax=Fictibacillus iocasae TaxID=2715437 RepID=A0ABW2NNA8_9BACL
MRGESIDTLHAIKTRRSIGKVKDAPVSNELIEQVLEAGTYAPNHYRTEPWRFFVLTGDSRYKLAEVLAEVAEETAGNKIEAAARAERARTMPLRAPVIIAVGAVYTDQKNVVQKEEYAAVCCAVQNMLLAAHDLGLGAMWRTGQACYHPKITQFFGLPHRSEMAAFLYIGHTDRQPPDVKKNGYVPFTVWMN